MPGKAFVMAFVWSGWLIASVIAFMIVAYASFFGVGLIGLMIWFVTARVDMEQDGVVGAGVSPSFLAQQVKVRTEMSRAPPFRSRRRAFAAPSAGSTSTSSARSPSPTRATCRGLPRWSRQDEAPETRNLPRPRARSASG